MRKRDEHRRTVLGWRPYPFHSSPIDYLMEAAGESEPSSGLKAGSKLDSRQVLGGGVGGL